MFLHCFENFPQVYEPFPTILRHEYEDNEQVSDSHWQQIDTYLEFYRLDIIGLLFEQIGMLFGKTFWIEALLPDADIVHFHLYSRPLWWTTMDRLVIQITEVEWEQIRRSGWDVGKVQGPVESRMASEKRTRQTSLGQQTYIQALAKLRVFAISELFSMPTE